MNAQFTKTELHNILNDQNFLPEKLIELLRIDFGDMYDADAGVWEGYTIAEHSIMVMKQFERYFSYEKLPANINKGLFRLILVLHDIGKPIAIAKGDKHDQHKYTIAVIDNFFDELGLSEKNKKVVIALVNQDSLGEYIRDRKNIVETTNEIKQSAHDADMRIRDFFELLTIFYRCDAGSYTLDAGGKESLDYLFIFDRETSVLSFAPDILVKIQKLEDVLALQ